MKCFKTRQQKDVYLYIFVFLFLVALVVVVVAVAAAAVLPAAFFLQKIGCCCCYCCYFYCSCCCCCCCATKTRPCRTGKHHGPEGRIMELKIGISRGRNVPSEMLVQLTLQKGGFRQGNPMPLKGDSDCCCCCAHKDTALPDGKTPWPSRTNGVQNIRFPRPERPF